jgi:hypothetical protein
MGFLKRNIDKPSKSSGGSHSYTHSFSSHALNERIQIIFRPEYHFRRNEFPNEVEWIGPLVLEGVRFGCGETISRLFDKQELAKSFPVKNT